VSSHHYRLQQHVTDWLLAKSEEGMGDAQVQVGEGAEAGNAQQVRPPFKVIVFSSYPTTLDLLDIGLHVAGISYRRLDKQDEDDKKAKRDKKQKLAE